MRHQVYVIRKCGVVLYVGRTVKLSSRLYAFRRRTGLVEFDVETFDADSLKDSMNLELELTDKLKPTLMRRRVSSYGAFSASFSEQERARRSKRARENNPGKSEASRKSASERMKLLNATNNPAKSAKNREAKRQLCVERNRKIAGDLQTEESPA